MNPAGRRGQNERALSSLPDDLLHAILHDLPLKQREEKQRRRGRRSRSRGAMKEAERLGSTA
jgi:hypothetical protein